MLFGLFFKLKNSILWFYNYVKHQINHYSLDSFSQNIYKMSSLSKKEEEANQKVKTFQHYNTHNNGITNSWRQFDYITTKNLNKRGKQYITTNIPIIGFS